MAAFVLTDPNPLGVVAMGAKGRGSGGAHPLVAALMAPFLFSQALAQRLHQLVKAAEGLDAGLFFGGQVLFGQLLQPVLGQGDGLQHLIGADRLQPLEGLGKGTVKAVEVALVLYHGGAREVIEPLGVVGDQTGGKALQKGKIFLRRDRHALPAQRLEEGQEHRSGHARDRDAGNHADHREEDGKARCPLCHVKARAAVLPRPKRPE